MSIVNLDFESRSKIDLPTSGLDLYATDPSTQIICMAYSIDKGPVQLWTPDQPLPAFMSDPTTKFQAFNAMFEWHLMTYVLKLDIPLENMIDTMAVAGVNNIPQGLEEAAIFLNCQEQKDPIGKRLISKLSKPQKDGTFNMDPVLLKQMYDYCIKDVKTEMDIASKLRPLSEEEQKVWVITQKINLTGIPVDVNELHNAISAVDKAQDNLNKECLALTGCKPSERQKLLDWLNARGANLPDLTSETVSAALPKLVDTNLRRALELRQEGSLTSLAKYSKMLEIQRDGRIRNTLIYSGANTGRWASRGGLNAQNFARPTVEVTEELIERVLGFGEGATTQELSSLLRSSLKAPEGHTFISVDYSSIENRVLAWLSGQHDKLALFKAGGDEYVAFASKSLFRVPPEQVTKEQRQIAKAAVLGNGFGQGAKGFQKYAENFGLTLSEQEADKIVKAYRTEYSCVKESWYAFEDAAISAIRNPGQPFQVGKVTFKVAKDALWMRLPSGRLLAWRQPKIQKELSPWGAMRDGIVVRNQSTYTRQWGFNKLIGSSIVQSATQAVARDLLSHTLLRLYNETNIMVNMLIHDEILCEVKEEEAEAMLAKITDIMCQGPEWSEGLPINAEGYISRRYKK